MSERHKESTEVKKGADVGFDTDEGDIGRPTRNEDYVGRRTGDDAIRMDPTPAVADPPNVAVIKHLGGLVLDEESNETMKAKVWNEATSFFLPSASPIPSSSSSHSSLSSSPRPPEWDEASKEPLDIIVENGSRFYNDPRLIYPMHSSPRGLALIINNIQFDSDIYSYRKGAHVDSDNLVSLFTQLGFKVESHQNQTRTNTLKTLIEFADRKEHAEADMVVVCVLSHGTQHGKIASSDCLDIDTENDILRRFNNDYCPSLRGKPKFFIFQACRGEEKDYGTIQKDSAGDETDAKATRTRSISMSAFPPTGAQKGLTWEDILIAYATLPGYVSNRDHFRGTWFIECFCKVLMTQAKDTSLRDMLDLVGMELRDYVSESGTKQSFSYDVRHFYRKVYFNPGLVSDPKEKWKHETTLGGRTRAVSTVTAPNPGDLNRS